MQGEYAPNLTKLEDRITMLADAVFAANTALSTEQQEDQLPFRAKAVQVALETFERSVDELYFLLENCEKAITSS
jgi:hypothetical protein